MSVVKHGVTALFSLTLHDLFLHLVLTENISTVALKDYLINFHIKMTKVNLNIG